MNEGVSTFSAVVWRTFGNEQRTLPQLSWEFSSHFEKCDFSNVMSGNFQLQVQLRTNDTFFVAWQLPTPLASRRGISSVHDDEQKKSATFWFPTPLTDENQASNGQSHGALRTNRTWSCSGRLAFVSHDWRSTFLSELNHTHLAESSGNHLFPWYGTCNLKTRDGL
jgi:hypothetical protein